MVAIPLLDNGVMAILYAKAVLLPNHQKPGMLGFRQYIDPTIVMAYNVYLQSQSALSMHNSPGESTPKNIICIHPAQTFFPAALCANPIHLVRSIMSQNITFPSTESLADSLVQAGIHVISMCEGDDLADGEVCISPALSVQLDELGIYASVVMQTSDMKHYMLGAVHRKLSDLLQDINDAKRGAGSWAKVRSGRIFESVAMPELNLVLSDYVIEDGKLSRANIVAGDDLLNHNADITPLMLVRQGKFWVIEKDGVTKHRFPVKNPAPKLYAVPASAGNDAGAALAWAKTEITKQPPIDLSARPGKAGQPGRQRKPKPRAA